MAQVPVRVVAIGLGAIIWAATLLSAQVRDKAVAPSSGTAVISGRVLDVTSGEPVRNAQVRAVDATVLPHGRIAVTDGDGRYTLTEMPAGHYTVSSAKSTFVGASYGQDTRFDEPLPIALADGQTASKIDVRLAHAGVVAGRITDDRGEPLPGITIAIIRRVFLGDGRSIWQDVARRTTNDLGEFRAFGLSPGRYAIGATPPSRHRDETDPNPRPYVATYFPGTSNADEAQLFPVAAGQVVSNMNFVLRTAHAVRVSGTAVDATGRPLAGGVTLYMPAMAMLRAQLAADGAFTFPSVPPGEYTLQAGGWEPREPTRAAMTVTVGDADLTDVALVGVTRTTVSGRVIVDPAATATIAPAGFDLLDDNLAPGQGSLGRIKAKDDFTFQSENWPGRVLIGFRSSTPGWILKQVRLNGQDITESGLDLGAGPVTGVEVEITNVTSEVSGVVRDANGKPTRRAWVILFSQNRQKWRTGFHYTPNPNVIALRPDATSTYRAKTMPTGAYYAVALGVETIETDDWRDPDLLERLQSHAIAFDARGGDRKTLDLTVTTLEP